jgi:hypothetical protein
LVLVALGLLGLGGTRPSHRAHADEKEEMTR